jgi:hypothetical protein
LIIPYDGGEIGEWRGDAIRNISGNISVNGLFGVPGGYANGAFEFFDEVTAWGGNIDLWTAPRLRFRASNVVPTANENRPASISVYPCISY